VSTEQFLNGTSAHIMLFSAIHSFSAVICQKHHSAKLALEGEAIGLLSDDGCRTDRHTGQFDSWQFVKCSTICCVVRQCGTAAQKTI